MLNPSNRPCAQKDPAARPPKRRKLCAYSGPEPSVEEIEGEFWRIVEAPDQVPAGFSACP